MLPLLCCKGIPYQCHSRTLKLTDLTRWNVGTVVLVEFLLLTKSGTYAVHKVVAIRVLMAKNFNGTGVGWVRPLAGRARTLTGRARTLTGRARTLTGRARTLAGTFPWNASAVREAASRSRPRFGRRPTTDLELVRQSINGKKNIIL